MYFADGALREKQEEVVCEGRCSVCQGDKRKTKGEKVSQNELRHTINNGMHTNEMRIINTKKHMQSVNEIKETKIKEKGGREKSVSIHPNRNSRVFSEMIQVKRKEKERQKKK